MLVYLRSPVPDLCFTPSFVFCPVQCVLAGHWIVLEDIDCAPPDVVRY